MNSFASFLAKKTTHLELQRNHLPANVLSVKTPGIGLLEGNWEGYYSQGQREGIVLVFCSWVLNPPLMKAQ